LDELGAAGQKLFVDASMPHLLPCRLELISHFGEIIGVQQCNQAFEVDHHHEVLVLVDLGDLAVANLPYE